MNDLSDEYGSDINSYPEPESNDHVVTDLVGTTPIFGNMFGSMLDNGTNLNNPETSGVAANIGSAIGMAGGIADFGLQITSMVGSFDIDANKFNPSGMLGGFALDFLLYLITPLEDLLYEVSGNPDQMQDQIVVWERVGIALQALSDEVAESTPNALSEWSGGSANAASAAIEKLTKSITAMANGTDGMQQTLAWAQALANLIFEVIKTIIAKLLEFLIMWGVPALAAAKPTFGASVAKFSLAAAKQAATSMIGASLKATIAMTVSQILANAIAASASPFMANAFSGQGSEAEEARADMGEGMTMDIDQFANAANIMHEHSARAGEIKTVAQEAASEDMTWGITGIAFASSYANKCDEYMGDFDLLVDELESCASRLLDTAETSSATDNESADEFAGLDDMMD